MSDKYENKMRPNRMKLRMSIEMKGKGHLLTLHVQVWGKGQKDGVSAQQLDLDNEKSSPMVRQMLLNVKKWIHDRWG